MKAEINNCMEQAEQSLNDARLLWEVGKSPRAAISRAYYAIFYASQAALETKELVATSHRAHISLFGEHFVKTGIFSKDLGKTLGNFFSLRQSSDYDLDAIIPEQEVEISISDAEAFVSIIRAWLSANHFL